jgi:hypothetical protein
MAPRKRQARAPSRPSDAVHAQAAVDGGAAGADDPADVGRLEAPGLQPAGALESLQKLWEAQAAESAANAWREAAQQKFNRRMAWAAVLLAGAAVVVPFVILWLDKALSS